MVFTALIAVPYVAVRWAGLPAVVGFWIAYVLTRPLGASFADWMGKSRHAGGLGWGDGPVAFGLVAMIVALVAVVVRTRDDREGSAS